MATKQRKVKEVAIFQGVKQMIDDHSEAIKDGLRKTIRTILKSLQEHQLIQDKDFFRLKNMTPTTQLNEILYTIGNIKDRQQFEIFRDILKHHKQTALYDLLDLDKQSEGKKETDGENNYLQQLRDELLKTNKKMGSVMSVVRRIEYKQEKEIKTLRTDYQQKLQECDMLNHKNSNLKSKIGNLNKELNKCHQTSKERIKQLENELKTKQEELENNDKIKRALTEKVEQLRQRIRLMEAGEVSSVNDSPDEAEVVRHQSREVSIEAVTSNIITDQFNESI